jgi:hypothetical protein
MEDIILTSPIGSVCIWDIWFLSISSIFVLMSWLVSRGE